MAWAGGAAEQECHRGTLDKQYCNRNYDLVADLPVDPAKWINPDTIIVSYTPVDAPAPYAKAQVSPTISRLRRLALVLSNFSGPCPMYAETVTKRIETPEAST